MKTPSFLPSFLLVAALFSSQMAFSQSGAKWAVNGNPGDSTTFIGTTNTFPLLFKVDNTKWMSLSTTGQLRLEALAATGTGFAWFDANGNLMRTNFPNDTNKVLTGNGTFSDIATLSGWKIVGNDMFNVNSGFVGIGTSAPVYPLDVNGNMRVNGIIYAQGVVLATKVQADTMKSPKMIADTLKSAGVLAGTIKSTGMISINDNLNFSGGAVNEIYTMSGDIKLQSNPSSYGNTILNAGTNGNVGIGTSSPQYKMDVNGDVRVSGSIRTQRIKPLPGDTAVIIGDSSIWFSASNRIFLVGPPTIYKGIAMGSNNSTAYGLNSLALGTRCWVTNNAPFAIALGLGTSQGALKNDIARSLMIGFNSNIPTFFVGPANGVGSIGKVGVGTTDPHCELDVVAPLNTGGFCVTTNYNIPYGYNIWAQVNGSPLTKAIAVVDQNANDQFLVYGDGTVFGREFKVTLGTFNHPDYVFAPGYKLMPRNDLRLYLITNRHLPGVPSSLEVKKNNGINLGEMAEANLEKTEELYLYMLQLADELEAVKLQNQLLQAQIDELKKK